jgi:DNA-binding transcriptional MerR regulator
VDRRHLTQLAREPLYNTRAVAKQTSIPADTFRAWERRYGVPRPQRAAGNQRLYSELDIGIISWLRDRTNEGMTISQAVKRLRSDHGEVLADALPATVDDRASEPLQQYRRLRQDLVDALVEYDGVMADHVIDETFALLTIESALGQVIEPTLNDISERWSRNAVSIGVEHFAHRTLSRRLASAFNVLNPTASRGQIVLACAPGEDRETRLLMLAIALTRRHWRVVYLGHNIPTSVLVDVARQIAPDLVYTHATTPALAIGARQAIREVASTLPMPVRVAIGGRGIDGMSSSTLPGARLLHGSADEVADQIVEIIETRVSR